MKRVLTVAAAACFLFATGCPSGSGGGKSGGGGGGGAAGKTPEATFKAIKTASANDDHATMFKCMDPQAHDEILIGMTVGASFMSMGKDDETKKQMKGDLKAIMDEHGVPEMKKGSIDMSKPDAMKEAAGEMFANVNDKAALYSDLAEYMAKYAQKNQKVDYANATLKDVSIEGEKATGTIEMSEGKATPVQFVQRDGRWYMAMGKA